MRRPLRWILFGLAFQVATGFYAVSSGWRAGDVYLWFYVETGILALFAAATLIMRQRRWTVVGGLAFLVAFAVLMVPGFAPAAILLDDEVDDLAEFGRRVGGIAAFLLVVHGGIFLLVPESRRSHLPGWAIALRPVARIFLQLIALAFGAFLSLMLWSMRGFVIMFFVVMILGEFALSAREDRLANAPSRP